MDHPKDARSRPAVAQGSPPSDRPFNSGPPPGPVGASPGNDVDDFLRGVGKKIAKFRSQKDMTQVQFSKKTGVSAQMVQYWESGRNITLKTLYHLSQHLNQPIECFFKDPGIGPQGTDPVFSENNGSQLPLQTEFLFKSILKGLCYNDAGPSWQTTRLLLHIHLACQLQTRKDPSRSQKMRILVIEDNPADAGLLRECFKQWGNGSFDLVHEPTLEGAVKRLSHEKVDLILLDLFLPKTSGLETVVEIQKSNTQAPLIILTGLYDQTMATEALQLGADFFLPKGLPEIIALIKALRGYVELK